MANDNVSGIHLWLVLWKAASAMENFDRRSIDSTSLCLSDFAVLEVLLHKGPLPVNTIGRKVLLTSGSMTSAISRLEKLKLVFRQQDESDRRVVRVLLTAAGEELIRSAFASHEKRMESAAEILSTDERKTLMDLLKKLGKHAEKISPEPFQHPKIKQ